MGIEEDVGKERSGIGAEIICCPVDFFPYETTGHQVLSRKALDGTPGIPGVHPASLLQYPSCIGVHLPGIVRHLELVYTLPFRPILDGECLSGLFPDPRNFQPLPGPHDAPLFPLHGDSLQLNSLLSRLQKEGVGLTIGQGEGSRGRCAESDPVCPNRIGARPLSFEKETAGGVGKVVVAPRSVRPDKSHERPFHRGSSFPIDELALDGLGGCRMVEARQEHYHEGSEEGEDQAPPMSRQRKPFHCVSIHFSPSQSAGEAQSLERLRRHLNHQKGQRSHSPPYPPGRFFPCPA